MTDLFFIITKNKKAAKIPKNPCGLLFTIIQPMLLILQHRELL